MWELGTNAFVYLWSWWCQAGEGIPLWNPFGAVLSVVLLLALIGLGIKHVLGKE